MAGVIERVQRPCARDRAQQDARGAALQRVPRVLPREPASSTSSPTTTTTSPRRTCRRRTSTSRRTRRSTTRSTACATPRPPRCSPAATSSSSPRSRASTGSARPSSTGVRCSCSRWGSGSTASCSSGSSSGMQYRRNDTVLSRGTFRVEGRGAGGLPRLHGDRLPDQPLRRRGRVDPALRPADRRGPRRGRPRRGLARQPLRDRGGHARPRRGRDQAGDGRADRIVRGARQAARGAPPAPAHRVRHRDAEGARVHLGDRELLADPRRARSRAARRTR